MRVELLLLDLVIADPAVQPRAGGLDPEHVADLAAAYRAKRPLPRPVVWKDGSAYRLSQGFHRFAGAKAAGLRRLECEVRKGSAADCADDAACSNQEHTALKRTNADKRRAVAGMLARHPDWSDRRIAEAVGVTHPFVSGIRGELETVTSSPDPAKRVGADGKARALPAPKAKSDPEPEPESEADPDPQPEPRRREDRPAPEPDFALFDTSPLVAAVERMIGDWSRAVRGAKTPADAAREMERLARSLMEQAARLRAAGGM